MLGAAVQAGFSFQSPSISADSDILEISQPIWQPRAVHGHPVRLQ